MINQRLFRTLQTLARQQTQQCAPKVQQRSISSSPFTSRSFAPAVSSRLAGQRWYSEAQAEKTAKQEQSGESKESEKVQEEAMKADPAQKELETKNKEVIDLTVCSMASSMGRCSITNDIEQQH